MSYQLIFIAGDSHTCGHEMPDNPKGQVVSKTAWSQTFCDRYFPNARYHINAKGGSSFCDITDNVVRMISENQKEIKNKKSLLIVMGTHHHRYKYWDTYHNSWQHLGNWVLHPDFKFFRHIRNMKQVAEAFFSHLDSWQYSNFLWKKNLLLIQSLSKSLGIDFLFFPLSIEDVAYNHYYHKNEPEVLSRFYDDLIGFENVCLFDATPNFSENTDKIGWYDYFKYKTNYDVFPMGHLKIQAHEDFAINYVPRFIKERFDVDLIQH